MSKLRWINPLKKVESQEDIFVVFITDYRPKGGIFSKIAGRLITGGSPRSPEK